MPKQRITKENVVDAAFELVRSGGMEQITVKAIAKKIGCSVQPIYSYCNNMEGLRQDVIAKTRFFIRDYVAARIGEEDPFSGTGKAYLAFSKEEPHLFRLFILHRRDGIASLDDLYRSETDPRMAEQIAEKLKISVSQAKKLHLNMLIYTMGIGAIFSVTSPGIKAEEVYEYQEMAYRAFLRQIAENTEEF